MVQLNLNLTHLRTYLLAHLKHAKLQKLVYACTVAHNFGVRMQASEHTQYTRDAYHELVLGLPYYMCGTTIHRYSSCRQ